LGNALVLNIGSKPGNALLRVTIDSVKISRDSSVIFTLLKLFSVNSSLEFLLNQKLVEY